jgi:ATP-dependent 26S proteasome regulatory subunit
MHKGNGMLNFGITSMSEIDMWGAKKFKEGTSREKQVESWKEVLTKFSQVTGGTETKRDIKIIEPTNSKKKE